MVAVYVGLDIGGTKLLAAAADACGVVLRRARAQTPAELDAGLSRLWALAREVAGTDAIAGVGAAIGGPIDAEAGIVSPLHQPNWRRVPLGELVRRELGAPFRVEVDTDAAALAERVVGGELSPRLLYLTLSTGMGGGLLLDGRIYRGRGGIHPEYAHFPVPCPELDAPPVCACGATGCLEALVSGGGIRRVYGKPAEALSPAEWSQVAVHLGRGLATLATVLGPGVIVLGGGVAVGGGERLVSQAAEVMRAGLRLVPAPAVRLSRLGYDTALHGAVTLARQSAGNV